MDTYAVKESPRVVFGFGTISTVRHEVEGLGRRAVLLLGTEAVADAADRIQEYLGDLVVARYDGAAPHTPVEVTDEALELLHASAVDCVVAVGGGTVTGLAKALAVRTDITQVIVPTTYAGSEMTPVLGETADGVKRTSSSERIRPGVVVYDVELTLGLPVALSVTSAVNAMAHAVEAAYAPGVDDALAELALEAIKLIGRAVPSIAAEPANRDARADLLRAASHAGTCLGSVGMGLHHKLCHTLGGSFGLPHAETHTVVLPYVMEFTAQAAPAAMGRIAAALGVNEAGRGVHNIVAAAGGPTSLRELGMEYDDLARAARLAAEDPYPHPRSASVDELEVLLGAAWRGDPPGGVRPSSPAEAVSVLTKQVIASFEDTPDPRLQQLLIGLASTLHDFVVDHDVTEREWEVAIDFLTRTGQLCDDKRQEFVLLSDVLGVSSAVDLLTNSRVPGTTPSAVLGPFYVAGPPPQDQGDDISNGLPGVPLWIDVRVVDTAGLPVAGATVDIWQSNQDGYYDVQLPDQDGPVLRGRFTTTGEGELRCWSILPCEYPIPEDGPVGALLAAAGRHPYRAPHVHFLIQAPGYRRLITQLFVRGGNYLDISGGRGDTVFGVKEELVVDFATRSGQAPDGRKTDGEWRALEFTFRIAPEEK